MYASAGMVKAKQKWFFCDDQRQIKNDSDGRIRRKSQNDSVAILITTSIKKLHFKATLNS